MVRSTTIELDTAREIAGRLEQWAAEHGSDEVDTIWSVVDPLTAASSGLVRQVTDADLPNLSDADRARLLLEMRGRNEVGVQVFTATVDFRQRIPTSVKVDLSTDSLISQQMAQEVAQKIIDEGSPRIDPRTWRRTSLYIPTIALAALWLALQVTSPLPLPAMLFGWVIVIVALAGTIALDRAGEERRERLSKGVAGLRIRSESRAQTRARRADQHTNIKVVAITAPISLLVGVAGTWIAFALHIAGK